MSKRLITIVLASFICVATIYAQEQEVKKPRLLIETFSCAEGLSNDLRDLLRMNIISAITATERFDIMDANTQVLLDEEAVRRTSTSAMADETARTEDIVTKANNYILRGSLLSFSTQSTVIDGKTRYTYELGYSITLIDAAQSTDIVSKTFSHGTSTQSLIGGTGGQILNQLSSYATAEDALKGGMSQIESDMKNLLIEHLPLEGELLTEDYEERRGKMETCYISIGSGLGVKVGDYFSILKAEVRAGRIIYQEIGRLKVKEVCDATLSHCSITKNNRLVLEKMNEYKDLAADDPDALPIIVRSTTAPLLSF